MIENPQAVKKEVARLCDAYEQALVTNDTEQLDRFFWQSDQALRFGVTEELYGADKISEFRKIRKINFTDRTRLRQEIVVFGEGFAVATLEFSVVVDGTLKHGRQTQVWARLATSDWRIVSAHVSHKVQPDNMSQAYANAASSLAGMPIAIESAHQVASELERMGRIVEPLMQFPLDDTVEPAPVFTP